VRLKALERENRELRQANEILKKASAYFAPPLDDASIACRATGRSSTAHSNDDWVHSLPERRVLPIASSTYYARVAVECDPDRASDRAKKDVGDGKDVERIYDASSQRYGARKIWHALRREEKDVARCTVERHLPGHCFAMPCWEMDERHVNTGCCTGWNGCHDQS